VPAVYLKYIKSVAYAAKNHINCACVDGMPYSVYRPSLLIGLAWQIVCFNTKFMQLLIITPIKNAICKQKENHKLQIINLHLWMHLYNTLSEDCILWLITFITILTVCKSLLKSINVIKPVTIAKGTRLITARNFPKKSPKHLHI
jgi:hypothetical protein